MSNLKEFSRAEVSKHNNDKSTWIIIENNVYDVTAFLREHPGGEETLLEEAGKDGTVAFIDVGHSSEARELMANYLIGQLTEDGKTKEKINVSALSRIKCFMKSNVKPIAPYLAAGVVIVGAVTVFRYYRSHQQSF